MKLKNEKMVNADEFGLFRLNFVVFSSFFGFYRAMAFEKENGVSFSFWDCPPTTVPSDPVVALAAKAFGLPSWNGRMPLDELPHRLEKIYKTSGFYGIFAHRGGSLVGMALASEKKFRRGAPYYFLQILCVEPSLQRCGLGRALIERMIEAARERKIRHLRLETLAGSRAERFYEEMGFEPVSPPRMGRRDQTMMLRL